jgi:hypothetical protein
MEEPLTATGPRLRIKVTADEDASLTVMFEPIGVTYELGSSEFMFAEIPFFRADEMEIVYWKGGISIWPPGDVTTFDSAGNELHRLNS